MSYNQMKLTVGLFVITLVIAISTFIFLFLEKKGAFDEKVHFTIKTPSANFFTVGMPLNFSGFEIGLIDSIALEKDGNVLLTFSVSHENRKWITEDTLLLLKKPLIGSPHIDIHSTIGSKPLKENSLIDILISDDINDMITKFEPAVNKLIKVISNIEVMTSYLTNKDSSLFKSLDNLQKFSYQLSQHDSLLTGITGDKASTNTLINTINQTQQIMLDVKNITANLKLMSQDISKITKTLDKKIITPSSTVLNNVNKEIIYPSSSAIKNIDKILLDVQKKLEYIDNTVKTIGHYDKDLIKMKEQVSTALQKSNLLMDKIDNWMESGENTEINLP